MNNGLKPYTFTIIQPDSRDLDEWVTTMADAILSVDDVNVVIVDWTIGAHYWRYWKIGAYKVIYKYKQALTNTLVVGHQLFNFLQNLKVSIKLM